MWIVVAASPIISLIASQLQIYEAYFQEIPRPLFVGVTLVIGGLSADYIAIRILKIRHVRKMLLGKDYIEGHWFLTTQTSSAVAEASPLVGDAVLYLRYMIDEHEVKAVTTRLDSDGTNTFPTESRIAYVGAHGPNLMYLNSFYFTYGGLADDGIAAGSFSTSSDLDCHDMFQGRIVTNSQRVIRNQRGYRISEPDLEWLSRHYGKDKWIAEFLKADGTTISDKIGHMKSVTASPQRRIGTNERENATAHT
ncbi:MAG: hypothetical protein HQL40_16330 [Alphaproteobacteria bacterium]|nr:hypothetical protein [Alphaproteobacteria bacterium]